ncbi:MAG TPA: response regulator [Candidatus Limnocylindria bacterium]|jgi:signal transduction histidine kinase|nr:response regulator [Candidatus Limnocylindria bacterium]
MSLRSRVLVVDDEMGVRESLRAILHGDCEVVTASSGHAALEVIARDPVDAMTLDLRMPDLGGIGVLERAKQIDPDLEVLIITGYGSLDTAVQGLRLRAFDYLSKPFDSAQVRRLVARAIARRAAVRRMKTLPEELLSNLSHELRTPLNVIMGYSSILLEEDTSNLSAEQRLALDRIQSNSTSLLGYVETIFYMAELDRGLMPLARDAVRVTDLLARVGAELAPRARAKGLGWRLDAPAELPLVTDADKLGRLMRALADNAVRYTTQGEVVLVARPAATGVTLEVRDSGPGIDPELIVETEDVIAGRAATRPPRLLGFGLRLAGRLVRILGASLTLAAGPQGSTCHLVVPDLAAAESGQIARAATA